MQAAIHCDVAICGGGLGGLALAAGLLHRGYNVRVFEASPALRTATSTMIGLGGNAWAALNELHPGLVARLQERGALARTGKHSVKVAKDAEEIVFPIPFSNDFYTIRWSEVQNVLAGLVPPEAVHCGYYATGYTESPDGGPVHLHFKGKPDVVARLAIGAEGLRSALRATMVPQDPGPRYLGHMNWHALLYNPHGSVVEAHGTGDLQVTMNRPRHDDEQWTLMTYVMDAGGGYTFWQVRIESEQPSFTPAPGTDAPDIQLDPGSMQSGPQLVGGGLGKPGSKARVERILSDAGYDHVLKVVQATPESDIFERALLDRIPLDELGATMVSPGGRVVLLGDAAHAMHPGPGQGACTAFEDAHTLTRLLDQHRPGLAGWAPAATAAGRGIQEAEAAMDATAMATDSLHGLQLDQAAQTATEMSLDHPSAAQSPDLAALRFMVQAYNAARCLRTCCVQRMAASGCGLASIRAALKPKNLTPEQTTDRFREFLAWLRQYPNNPSGDPQSKYWKPVEQQ